MSVLAIDAGTTGVTAVVVTEDGTIAAKGYQEFAQHFPQPGWVEHAPEEIWQATLEATRHALSRYDASELKAVGITNQRETILLWDRETLGSPRRAIVWQDRRTADICTRLRDDGHEDRVAELTGLRLDPYFSGTKLMWLAEHEPHTWALVESGRYAVGTVDSYLIARMTRGTYHVTDVSNACRTLLFDLDHRRLVRRALLAVRRAARRAARAGAQLGRDRHHRPGVVPRPGAADRRARRRPAVGAVRADLLRRRRLQVHLRHRLVHPHQHRHHPGALGRRPALDGGVAVAGRRADLRARGRDLRDRRRGAVAARRTADRRLRRGDRGDRQDRATTPRASCSCPRSPGWAPPTGTRTPAA